MPGSVDREELQRLVEERNAQIVEVLPRPEYEWAHLPGAVHLPLKQLDEAAAEKVLDRRRPVIVYCNDFV